ncbi:MAG TPA: TonB-dependent receptor [Opitutaceae bacterium]|nr:TonB-dependent receptor [Opitutaceae bacterium]
MHIPSVLSFLRRRLASWALAGVLAAGPFARAAEPATHAFDLPAGRAEQTLKLLSRQAGVEVLFSSDAAAGVTTNAVKGRYTSLEAAHRMLDGTALSVRAGRDGVLQVARATDPNVERAVRTEERSRPAPELPTAADASADETIQLSPFHVSAESDHGYRTRDIVTGTKIATPLQESPLSVTVINHELLEDINVQRVTDALAFTQAGVSSTGRTWADQETFVFRGYEGAILRNGIRFNAWTDSSNIERVELARGPSAILYGFVAPGGVVNYVTKKPLPKSLAYFKAGWASEHGSRLEFDYNRPLAADHRLLLRVNGARSDGDTWIVYQTIHDTFLNPSVTWNISRSTSLSYDLTYRKRKGAFERIRFYYFPQRDGWPSLPLAPFNDQLGGTVGYDRNPGIAPWTWAEWDRRRHEVRLEHRFNDHFRFLAIGADDYSHVEQLTMFTFSAVRDIGYQNVFMPPPDHILLSSMPIYENVRKHFQYFEANLLAQFETKYFKSDTLIGVSGNRFPTKYDRNGYFAPEPSKIGAIDYTLASPYMSRVSDPLSKRYYYPNLDYRNWNTWFLDSVTTYDWGKADYFITESLGALDDRLHVLAGLRRQQYRELQLDRTLPQFGALYEAFKGVSVYGIWSETAESNGRTVRHQLPRPLSESKGWDAGVKFEAFGGKLAGSIAYFKITKSNLAINDPRAIVDYAAGLVDDTVTFTPGSESKGIEASLQFQPNRNFQAILSFADTDARILPGDPNPAAWNAPLVQVPPRAYTLFAKYAFTEGPLAKLAVGGGFSRAEGPIYVDNPVTIPLANKGGYFLVNAFVRYGVKVYGRDVGLQVAGNNLTDDRFLQNGGYNPPREYTLSFDVKF